MRGPISIRQAGQALTVGNFVFRLQHKPLGHAYKELVVNGAARARLGAQIAAWPRDRLWLCVGGDSGPVKACVRERARRRTTAALEAALRARGYDARGRPRRSGRGGGLIGSLSIFPRVPGPALDADMPSLTEAMGGMVEAMEAGMHRKQRKSPAPQMRQERRELPAPLLRWEEAKSPAPLWRRIWGDRREESGASRVQRPSRARKTMEEAPTLAVGLACDF